MLLQYRQSFILCERFLILFPFSFKVSSKFSTNYFIRDSFWKQSWLDISSRVCIALFKKYDFQVQYHPFSHQLLLKIYCIPKRRWHFFEASHVQIFISFLAGVFMQGSGPMYCVFMLLWLGSRRLECGSISL